MTEKTEEQMDAEAEAFIQNIGDTLPDNLTNMQILRVLGTILSSYSTGPADTMAALRALSSAMIDFHAQAGHDTCDCPKCVARRKIH